MIYIHLEVYACACEYLYTYVHIYVQIYIYIYIYVYIYICIYICIYRGHLLCAAKEVPLNSDLGALRDYNDNNRCLYTIKDEDLWG
jgi:hypothetical protein